MTTPPPSNHPLDYHPPQVRILRPWIKWSLALLVLVSLLTAGNVLLPTQPDSIGWVCHICGRNRRSETWYFGTTKIWSRTRILDGDSGKLYDQLIGQPHDHDWHRAGFTTRHRVDGAPGDADPRIPATALDLIHHDLRNLPIDQRREIYRRIITGARKWEDVSDNFTAELKRLRAQGALPAN